MPSGYRERGRQTDRAEWSGVKRARGSCCGVSCTHPLCRDLRRFRRLKSGSRTIDRVRKSLSPSLARPESPRSPLVLREVASFSQVYFTSPVERGRRSGRDKTGDADGRQGEEGGSYHCRALRKKVMPRACLALYFPSAFGGREPRAPCCTFSSCFCAFLS